MVNSLAQMLLDPQQLGDSLTLFYETFDFSDILDSCGIKKRSGVSASEHIDYLLRLKLNKISAYRNQGKTQLIDNKGISYDASQRFKNREANDWVSLTVSLARKLDIFLNGDDIDLDPELPGGIFIADDTPFKRPKSKKTEAVSRNYDHNEKRHYTGFRGSGLMYYHNSHLIPISFVPVSNEDNAKVVGPLPKEAQPDSLAGFRQMLTLSTLPNTFLKQLDMVIEAGFKSEYCLFDSWYANPKMFRQLRERDIYGIGMLRTNGNTLFNDHGTKRTVKEIFEANRYNLQQLQDGSVYFSTFVTYEFDDGTKLPLKLVFTESVSDNKEFVCIATTDINLSDQTIILLYRIRWSIETFYQVSKSEELDLPKNGQGLSLAGVYADMALNCIYYTVLAYLNSLSCESSSLYECFYEIALQCKAVKVVEVVSITVNTALAFVASQYNLNFSKICEEVSPVLLEQEVFKKIWQAASMGPLCSKIDQSILERSNIIYIT